MPSKTPPAAAGWKEGRAAGSIRVGSIAALVTAKSRVPTSNTGDFVPPPCSPDAPDRGRRDRFRDRRGDRGRLLQDATEGGARRASARRPRAGRVAEPARAVRAGARGRARSPAPLARRLLRQ